MNTTIAFRAIPVGHKFAATPACLVLTITDRLRQEILDATTAIRQFGFKEVVLAQGLGAPKVCDEDMQAELEDLDFVRVTLSEFDEVERQRLHSMAVVVDFCGDLRVNGYDYYGEHLIESPRVRITSVLELAPLEESA